MKFGYVFVAMMAAFAIGAGAAWAQDEDQLALEPGDAQPQGVQVLTRGPVHEAFAEPVSIDTQPNLVITRKPPDPIDELPPDVKPEGNATWISGYWAWDDESNDFLWVSGAWRVAPAGQRWVPGYWAEIDQGYQHVAGFWTDEATEEVAYLPEPPQSQEHGPNSAQPSENHFWVPGTWRYASDDYAWSPGYWARVQPNWVWIPARTVWTPAGYVFVRGYWDLPLVRRGWLFAPVHFSSPVYAQSGFVYTPSVVLNTRLLSVQLFTRPRWNSYYFGDYYDARYADAGFVPWYQYGMRSYDPIFTYQRYTYSRRDPQWMSNLERDFARRRSDPNLRPPRTFSRADIASGSVNTALALNLRQFTSQEGLRDRVQRLERNQRQEFSQEARDMRRLHNERRDMELRNIVRTGDAATRGRAAQAPETLRLTPSGRSADVRRGLDRTPGSDRELGSDRIGTERSKRSLDDRSRVRRGDDERATTSREGNVRRRPNERSVDSQDDPNALFSDSDNNDQAIEKLRRQQSLRTRTRMGTDEVDTPRTGRGNALDRTQTGADPNERRGNARRAIGTDTLDRARTDAQRELRSRERTRTRAVDPNAGNRANTGDGSQLRRGTTGSRGVGVGSSEAGGDVSRRGIQTVPRGGDGSGERARTRRSTRGDDNNRTNVRPQTGQPQSGAEQLRTNNPAAQSPNLRGTPDNTRSKRGTLDGTQIRRGTPEGRPNNLAETQGNRLDASRNPGTRRLQDSTSVERSMRSRRDVFRPGGTFGPGQGNSVPANPANRSRTQDPGVDRRRMPDAVGRVGANLGTGSLNRQPLQQGGNNGALQPSQRPVGPGGRPGLDDGVGGK